MKMISVQVDDGFCESTGIQGIMQHVKLMHDAELLADWCERELGIEHLIEAVILLRRAASILEQRSNLDKHVRRVQTYTGR